MRHIVNDSNYLYICDVKKLDIDSNDVEVCFYTQYKDAKNPNELQRRFQMILTQEEFVNFGRFLNDFAKRFC